MDAISGQTEKTVLQAIDTYIAFRTLTPLFEEQNERHVSVFSKLASVLFPVINFKNVHVDTIQKLVGVQQALAAATQAMHLPVNHPDHLTEPVRSPYPFLSGGSGPHTESLAHALPPVGHDPGNIDDTVFFRRSRPCQYPSAHT